MILHTNLLNDKADDTAVVVAADVEGTLSAGAAWKGMRDYLRANGEGDKYKKFLRRWMFRIIKFRLGLIANERAFKEQWIVEMLHLFTGYSPERMLEMGHFVVENEVWPNRRQAVVDELLAHKENGRRIILVTGVMEPVLTYVAQKMGIEAIGTPLLYADGRFTGEIAGTFNTGESKVEQLHPFLEDGKIYSAYGDTAADIPMLNICHEPVAVYPDKMLRKTAVAHGWRILE